MAISVRACDEDEALEYVRDPSVVKWLKEYPSGISSAFIMLVMDEKLLVLAKPDGESVEVHIACKFRDRGTARETLEQGLRWFTGQRFKTVWTTASDDRKALVRMLESLQFRRVGERWEYGN
jgi:hypothetical protein